jgi:hypothetical protein
MALSQKHRIALCEHFVPHLGEDVTEALLHEFPDRDGDELVTKAFLRAELAELRAEFGGLRAEFGDLRAEFGGLRGELGGLRAEMHRLHAQTSTVLITVGGVMTAVLAVFN